MRVLRLKGGRERTREVSEGEGITTEGSGRG